MLKKTLVLLLAAGALMLGSLQAPTRAQDKPAPKATKEADAFTSTIAMRNEGLLFVDVMVNGKGPYNFLFDSGASITILSDRVAIDQELTVYESPAGGAQGVGTAEMRMTFADNLKVGDFSRDDVLVGVMNFDHISGELGKHIEGIIGQNLLKNMKQVKVDFEDSTLAITRYKRGEGPQLDMQEMMMKMMLQRTKGEKATKEMFKKKPGDEPKKAEPGKRPGKKEPEKEEEFSVGGTPLLDLLGPDEKTEAKPLLPTEKLEFAYKGLEMMGMEIDALWFMEAKINGKQVTMFFDTGASTLCVLDKEAADGMGVPVSYSYPVKGVGQGEAYEGLLDTLQVGNLSIDEPTCSVMDLSGPLAQVKMLGTDCAGIIGLPLASRFKTMTVDNTTKKVRLEPYTKDDKAEASPLDQERHMKEAVLRVWNKQAGNFGMQGDAVELDEWKELGLESGAMRVTDVTSGGAAAKGGIKVGDLVTKLAVPATEKQDPVAAEDVRGFNSVMIWGLLHDPGTEVELTIKRGKEVMTLRVTLQTYPFDGVVPKKHQR